MDKLQEGLYENTTTSGVDLQAKIETTITRTFIWLGCLLLISFGIGYSIYMYAINGAISINSLYIMALISAFGGLGLVIAISFFWQKMSYVVLATLLIIFAILEGFGLSVIFMQYALNNIIYVLLITSLMFFGLVMIGYITKADITKFGPILFMGLIAILIMIVINMFVKSSQFDFIISILGVIIISGLIIYHMSTLKQMAISNDNRVELIMSLSFFISFINLFLFLLRLIGGGKE